MSGFPRGRTAIVSTATFGIGEAPGYSAMDIAAKAALIALDRAGLRPRDVDALFCILPQDPFCGLSMAEYLGIRPAFCDNNRTGGSSFQMHAITAALALDAGLCDVALICYGSNQRTAAGGLLKSGIPPFPYEAHARPLGPVTGHALAAARHMHEYGTTRDHLADVVLAARDWANLNPDAFRQGALSRAEVLGGRMISAPLTARDCCLITDGGAAVVMMRADRARDICPSPAYLLGGGSATWHRHISTAPDLTTTAAVDSGRAAYAHAGYGPSDMDVVQLYDAFSINTILFLEDLGFCAKGEGGPFVANGNIAPGGGLAVNTNGGGLSCVHPGMYGLFAMIEAVEQITGRAGVRQVEGAKLGLAHGNGGSLSAQSTIILGASETI